MPFDLKALVKDAKEVPWWGWALGGGAILAGGYYLRRGASSAPASKAQPEYQPPDGLAMTDLAGLPVDYYDWSPGMPGGDSPPPPPPTTPPPSGNPPPTTTPPPTTARVITLQAPESFQQLADQYEGGQQNLPWLLSWNRQLQSRQEYSKTWWPLPKGTRVNIPARPTAGTGHGGGHYGGLHDWPEWAHLSAFDTDMLHAQLESGAMYG